MPEHQQTQQSRKPETSSQKLITPVNPVRRSNPVSIIQRAGINPKSLTYADIMQLQRTIGNRAVGRLLSEIRRTPSTAQPTQPIKLHEIPTEEKPLRGKMIETVQLQEIPEEKPLQGKMIGTIQRQEIPEEKPLQLKRGNNTGMPDNLKAGVESLSGIDISDVRVHYNSSKPAQVGALAYTQGTNIHVSPGQEKHLPHEAWHVVQQAQGRVMPTIKLKGIAVNDDTGLEHEADVMGAKAMQTQSYKNLVSPGDNMQINNVSPSVAQLLIISLDPEDSTIESSAGTIKSTVLKGSDVKTLGTANLSGLGVTETIVILGHGERLSADKEPNMAWDKEYDDPVEKTKRELDLSHRPATKDLPIMTPEGLFEELISRGWSIKHKGDIDFRSCWSAMPSFKTNFIFKFVRLLHAEGRQNRVIGYKGPTETESTGEEKERAPFWYQLEESRKVAGAMNTLITEYFDKVDFQNASLDEYKSTWFSEHKEGYLNYIEDLVRAGFPRELAEEAVSKKREEDWKKEFLSKSAKPELNFNKSVMIQNRPNNILKLIRVQMADFGKMKQLGIPLWKDEQKAFELFEQANKYIGLDKPVRIDRDPGKALYKYLAQPELLEEPTKHLVSGNVVNETEWKTTIDPLNLSMKGYHEI